MDLYNIKLQLSLHIKQKAHKYTMQQYINKHKILLLLGLIFGLLAQVEQENGILNLHNFQELNNNFGLQTIFLVLEEPEMIC